MKPLCAWCLIKHMGKFCTRDMYCEWEDIVFRSNCFRAPLSEVEIRSDLLRVSCEQVLLHLYFGGKSML
jgi:hypothetical protein